MTLNRCLRGNYGSKYSRPHLWVLQNPSLDVPWFSRLWNCERTGRAKSTYVILSLLHAGIFQLHLRGSGLEYYEPQSWPRPEGTDRELGQGEPGAQEREEVQGLPRQRHPSPLPWLRSFRFLRWLRGVRHGLSDVSQGDCRLCEELLNP